MTTIYFADQSPTKRPPNVICPKSNNKSGVFIIVFLLKQQHNTVDSRYSAITNTCTQSIESRFFFLHLLINNSHGFTSLLYQEGVNCIIVGTLSCALRQLLMSPLFEEFDCIHDLAGGGNGVSTVGEGGHLHQRSRRSRVQGESPRLCSHEICFQCLRSILGHSSGVEPLTPLLYAALIQIMAIYVHYYFVVVIQRAVVPKTLLNIIDKNTMIEVKGKALTKIVKD